MVAVLTRIRYVTVLGTLVSSSLTCMEAVRLSDCHHPIPHTFSSGGLGTHTRNMLLFLEVTGMVLVTRTFSSTCSGWGQRVKSCLQ